MGLIIIKKLHKKQHEDCEYCKNHPEFNLSEKIFIHGKYYTKNQILKALIKMEKKK